MKRRTGTDESSPGCPTYPQMKRRTTWTTPQVYHSLTLMLAALVILSVPSFGLVMSDEASAVTIPRHLNSNTSSSTQRPRHGDFVVTSLEPSTPKLGGKPKATVQIYPGSDERTAPRKRVLSPEELSDTILQMMDTLKTMSDEFKMHKAVTLETSGRLDKVIPAINDLKKWTTSTEQTLTKMAHDVQHQAEQVQRSMRGIEASTRSACLPVQSSVEDPKKGVKVIPLNVEGSGYRTAFFNVPHVRDIARKVKTSRREFATSPLFVVDGYTAKLHLYAEILDDELWLGVYFRLCPGSEDSLLLWPFRTNYTVSIFHPDDEAKDVKKTVNAGHDTCKDSGSFEKPKTGCNKTCGVDKLILWELAEKQGYIHDNYITVGATFTSGTTSRTSVT